MVPNVSRGHSAIALTVYLMNPKRQAGEPADMPGIERDGAGGRVGNTMLMNFIGDEARDPHEAAKIMALVVRDADLIKQAAGVAPGGRKAEKPPIWHLSLSWHESEQVDWDEKVRAARSCLKAVGLAAEKGYLSSIVEHVDTPHPHIHVVVCLVHPETGKQANPYRDLPRAQEWAAKYEKARGHVFCEDRDAKYAEIEEARAQARKPAPPKPGEKRRLTREEWAAMKAARNLKADIAQRFAAQRAGEEAAKTQRSAELAAFYARRKVERNALWTNGQAALDELWRGPGRYALPANAQPRDFNHLAKLAVRLNEREAAFMRRERTAFGRLQNAIRVAGKDAGFGRIFMLVVLADERRKAFRAQQRQLQGPMRDPRTTQPKPRLQLKDRKAHSAELKRRRTADLAVFDQRTKHQADQIRKRHLEQRKAEGDARRALGKEADALWQQHRQQYGWAPPASHAFRKAAAAPYRPPQADFGRSGGMAAIAPDWRQEAGDRVKGKHAPDQTNAPQPPPAGQERAVSTSVPPPRPDWMKNMSDAEVTAYRRYKAENAKGKGKDAESDLDL